MTAKPRGILIQRFWSRP
uniref:Uncharacterized protein n=1 Tax=Rhizophora mucronata TaxID=61149 RepID=A0A2P2JRR2_RHIMU